MNGLIALGAGIAALTGIGGGIGIFLHLLLHYLVRDRCRKRDYSGYFTTFRG